MCDYILIEQQLGCSIKVKLDSSKELDKKRTLNEA